MDKVEVERVINKNRNRHLSNKVLHAHPSPAYWTQEFQHDSTKELLLKKEADKSLVNLYIGIPYCLPTDPGHCGFCLFPTQTYKGDKSMKDYLAYVEEEASLYRAFYQDSELKSLYIGGGTPNLLSVEDYPRLMNIVHGLFPDIPEVERTIEGIPQLFNENKIKAISEAGFNRVSMGVQQVNDKLIKYSGRKQTRKQVFEAIEYFDKYNLAANIDLIYAWPEQTIDDMLRDLNEITDTGVSHITHYELNIAGRSDFATKQKKLVPGIDKKIEMYRISKEFLRSQGYRQRTPYDWEKINNNDEEIKSSQYEYESNLHGFLENEGKAQRAIMGGLGFAAINMRIDPYEKANDSISAMNHRDLTSYYRDVLLRKLPIERVYLHSAEDVRLTWIFQCLQIMHVDMNKYKRYFNRDFMSDYKNIVDAIENEGWASIENNIISLKGDGEFYVPLIQSLFGFKRTKQISSRHIAVQQAV